LNFTDVDQFVNIYVRKIGVFTASHESRTKRP
jgi:hypothetical protein